MAQIMADRLRLPHRDSQRGASPALPTDAASSGHSDNRSRENELNSGLNSGLPTLPANHHLTNKYLHDLHTKMIQDSYEDVLAHLPYVHDFDFIAQNGHNNLAVRMDVGHSRKNLFRVGPDGSSYLIDHLSNAWAVTTDRGYPSNMVIYEPFSWDHHIKHGLRNKMLPRALTLVRYYCLLWANTQHTCQFEKLHYPSYVEVVDLMNTLRETKGFQDVRDQNPQKRFTVESLQPGEHNIDVSKLLRIPHHRLHNAAGPVREVHVQENASNLVIKDETVGSPARSLVATLPETKTVHENSKVDTVVEPLEAGSVTDHDASTDENTMDVDHIDEGIRSDKTNLGALQGDHGESNVNEIDLVMERDVCPSGPTALAFLRHKVADLALLPQLLDMNFTTHGHQPEYIPIRLRLGKYIGSEEPKAGGSVYAYLKKNRNRVVGPKHCFQVENPTIDHLGVSRVISKLVSYKELQDGLVELEEPFDRKPNDAQFYALIKYYFLLAVDSNFGGYSEHIIPINPSFVAGMETFLKDNSGIQFRRRVSKGPPQLLNSNTIARKRPHLNKARLLASDGNERAKRMNPSVITSPQKAHAQSQRTTEEDLREHNTPHDATKQSHLAISRLSEKADHDNRKEIITATNAFPRVPSFLSRTSTAPAPVTLDIDQINNLEDDLPFCPPSQKKRAMMESLMQIRGRKQHNPYDRLPQQLLDTRAIEISSDPDYSDDMSEDFVKHTGSIEPQIGDVNMIDADFVSSGGENMLANHGEQSCGTVEGSDVNQRIIHIAHGKKKSGENKGSDSRGQDAMQDFTRDDREEDTMQGPEPSEPSKDGRPRSSGFEEYQTKSRPRFPHPEIPANDPIESLRGSLENIDGTRKEHCAEQDHPRHPNCLTNRLPLNTGIGSSRFLRRVSTRGSHSRTQNSPSVRRITQRTVERYGAASGSLVESEIRYEKLLRQQNKVCRRVQKHSTSYRKHITSMSQLLTAVLATTEDADKVASELRQINKKVGHVLPRSSSTVQDLVNERQTNA